MAKILIRGSDLFDEELNRLADDYCVDPVAARNYVVSENYIYPITGRIGTLYPAALAVRQATSRDPPTLVDQFSFTTELSGSINPIVTFTPLARGLQLA